MDKQPRGIALAELIGHSNGVPLHRCRRCARPMQPDRRRQDGAVQLPGIPRHESDGYCQACRHAMRNPDGATRNRSEKPLRTHRLAVDELLAGLEWNVDAACGRTTRPDDFALPERYRGGPTEGAVRAAVEFCSGCPVLAECADFAEVHDSRYTPITGLWGGEWRTGTSVEPITTGALAAAGTRVTA